MTSRDFCYWLQGFIEVTQAAAPGTPLALTAAQLECMQRHLAMVFKHEIDPGMGDAEAQKQLNELHTAVDKLKRPKPGLMRC